MVDEQRNTLRDVIAHVGRFAPGAFLFVREGLGHAIEKIHGPENEALRSLQQFVVANDLEWSDLIERYDAGALPEPVREAIDQAGGCEKLDRHITGRQLCWGLRDYALDRWGMLAKAVLESWNVRHTIDFGRIVFGFIECDLMQKRPEDKLEDFAEIFSFDEAFDAPFGSGANPPNTTEADDLEN